MVNDKNIFTSNGKKKDTTVNDLGYKSLVAIGDNVTGFIVDGIYEVYSDEDYFFPICGGIDFKAGKRIKVSGIIAEKTVNFTNGKVKLYIPAKAAKKEKDDITEARLRMLEEKIAKNSTPEGDLKAEVLNKPEVIEIPKTKAKSKAKK